MAEEKAARLRETAASFRAQAAELENSRERERRMNADRSFNNFDSNRDGAVDAAELKAGLESPLRRSFTKQLTARMGRKPTPEEVSYGLRPSYCEVLMDGGYVPRRCFGVTHSSHGFT